MDVSARQKRFVELLTGHQRQLYIFVSAFLTDPHAVDEVLQRTNVVLWEKAESFAIDSDFAAWALTIARYEVLAYCKSRHRDRHSFNSDTLEALAEEATVDTVLSQRRREALQRCLQQLRDGDRALLHLRYEGCLSIEQIAAEVRRPVKSIYRSLARVRQSLLECINRRLRQEDASP